ncbi:MAG: trigger factor [Candidatus Zixiibacteriota bacterium]
MDVQAKITNEEGWKRTVAVSAPASEVDKAIATATGKYKGQVEIPGFRKGKAPDSVVRERFRTEIRQDAMEYLLPRVYEAALKKLDIIPVSQPILSKVKFEPGADMEFELQIEIRPQVEITGYKGLKIEKRVYEITDRDVELALDELRDQNAKFIAVQRPAAHNDVVTCNLQKIYDSKQPNADDKYDDVKFELKEGRTRPEFLAALPGMTVGEGKEVEITYPESEPDPDLSGKTVRFRVWLKEVAQKELPAADDEFAKTLGNFESIDKVREAIRRNLERRADQSSNKHVGEQIRKMVVEANQFEVPAGLLSEYIDNVYQKIKEANPELDRETVRKQFEPAAIEQFRWDFAVYEIAEQEGLKVTDEEVKEVLKTWPEDAEDRPSEQKIHESLLENRVYEYIVSQAEVTPVHRVLNPQIVTPSGEKAS